ncbi:hypothetical protein WJM97_06410 [Okeanomitos corallinicola TIOX110]|uniref:HTH tetR-type domain-containing protein n=1 Tax=Okeanomitos corallinicola TIOX110 TaxID=3133117 RepID=A0ABZ2UWF1_9CYAN
MSPKLFDSEQVQDFLIGVLESSQIPPSMREVAQCLGYDRRTIFQHFPDLCQAISANYLSYRRGLFLENLAQSCREVQQICAKLYHDGVYPSEARVSKLMTKPGYLRYKQVRTMLQQAQSHFSVSPSLNDC